ncbi:MAG: aldose 1-epimerase family protein [Chitinophagales bacterium]|nr:aldose 1-epimerase family protein [Chitinophagales bacterium]
MKHTLENQFLKVTVNEKGAELSSIWHKINQIEHLWQADPAWWSWHAPILFPVVGRCLEDKIFIDKQSYPMLKHGFARKSIFNLDENTNNQLSFILQRSPDTSACYPFDFELKISYTLSENTLYHSFTVINRDTIPLPFSIGGHPAFTVPFFKGESFSDYHIEFEHQEILQRHYINQDGYFNGKTEVISQNGKIDLHENLFSKDALIFKTHRSRSLKLKSKNHSRFIQVDFPDFPYLGIWTKPGAPFVCIEPWIGCADTVDKNLDFYHREGTLSLPAGKIFNAKFSITFA